MCLYETGLGTLGTVFYNMTFKRSEFSLAFCQLLLCGCQPQRHVTLHPLSFVRQCLECQVSGRHQLKLTVDFVSG